MTIRTYSELIEFSSFEERYHYLELRGSVGESTFGFERYTNQRFYRSKEWRDIRSHIIARDLGLDLGSEGFEIFDKITVHHMNPMEIKHLREGSPDIIDPEYLITTCHNTHMAIHYGDESKLNKPLVERTPGDTMPWLKR